jgi:TPR repeat protein
MYDKGLGVRQDYKKAVEWHQKAADQNDASAQFDLGVMYKYGKGVRQSNRQAKEWFGKACDNGSQNGCNAYRKLNQK